MLGVAQEQHGGRCALFAQWRGIPWPIAHDPINSLGLRGVPVAVGVDEYGIVRVLKPKPDTLERDFLDKTFAAPEQTPPGMPGIVFDFEGLARTARGRNTAATWRDLGDALALWAGVERADDAVDAYGRASQLAPDDAVLLFRLGVAHRSRFDSAKRRPGDFQTAADCWGRAGALDPGQYIWRRRVEQYGPRLTKPYPFYDWVTAATDAIRARGEQPVVLAATPVGSEIAGPSRQFRTPAGTEACPDPDAGVPVDRTRKVSVESAVVPARVAPGGAASVHLTLTPDPRQQVHWEDAAGPLRAWVEAPEGWQLSQRLLVAPPPAAVGAARHLHVEVKAPSDAKGEVVLDGFALYAVCSDEDGTCTFLRQEFRVPVRLGPAQR